MDKAVLIVDDSKTIRVQIKHVVKAEGFAVLEASNGKEAVDIYREKQDMIFMMFLDINMPEMNGIEVLENLMQDDSIKKPNVVVLTTEDSASYVEQAKSLGAKGWIVKPYKGDKLASAMRRFSQSA